MTEGLCVREAHISYGATVVLRGLSLDVRSGEIVAILGRSGCGKTTLLRACCALVPLASGEISLQGQQIINGPRCLFEKWEIRRKIMYVAQTPTLLPHLTAIDNVCLALKVVRGISTQEAKERSEGFALSLQLDRKSLVSYPEQLSGGEAQRVQLLRAMVLQPDFLLLDEITANIDPQTTSEVINTLWLLRERPQRRQTIVIVTHVVEFAQRFADRIVFIHDGVVHEQGAASEFASSVERDETRQFLSQLR